MSTRHIIKVFVITSLMCTFAFCQTAVAADRDDITDILPENVMFYANVNCQQIVKPQAKHDLPLTAKHFELIFWQTTFLPMGLQLSFHRGFDATNLERFVGQHCVFAQEQGSPAIELAFISDGRKEAKNVFHGIASFKLKDRQAYEDFVTEHLDFWEKNLMKHEELESASHKETDVTFHEFFSPFGPKKDEMFAVPVAFSWWFDGRVWISTNQELAEELIKRCQQPKQFESFARNNRRFEIVSKGADVGREELTSQFFIDYLNTFDRHPIWNYGRVVEENGVKKSMLAGQRDEYGKQFSLPYRDNLALWAEIHSDEDRSRWDGSARVLYAVPRRDPLSKMRLQLAEDWQVESWLPETTVTYGTTQFDAASDPQSVRELSTRMLGMDDYFADAGQELIDPIMRQLSDEQRQQVLSQLTGRMTTIATADYKSKMIILELNDAKKPMTLLQGVVTKWQDEAEQVERGDRKRRKGRFAVLKSERYKETDVYFGELNYQTDPMGGRYSDVFYAVPSVARVDNYLLFASDREFLKAAIDQRQSDQESEFVRALRKAIANSADLKHSDLVIFSKTTNLFRIAYDWLRVPPANKISELTSSKVRTPDRLTGPHDYLDGMNTLATKLIERQFTDSKQHALITMHQTEKTFEIQFTIR